MPEYVWLLSVKYMKTNSTSITQQESIYKTWKGISTMNQFVNSIPGHKVRVDQKYIQDMAKRVLVQFYRFPNTNSIVSHASIDGFELAVTSSPCVDANNFDESIGMKYGGEKAIRLANDALWSMAGAELIVVIRDNKLTPEEFSKKYEGKFIIEPI